MSFGFRAQGAQGSIEYVLIIAMAIFLVVIVVYALISVTGFGSSGTNSASQFYSASENPLLGLLNEMTGGGSTAVGGTALAGGYFSNGSGSIVDPYGITTCAMLQDMNKHLDASYVLLNDIDCSETRNWNDGFGFKPIGNSMINSSDLPMPFTGKLDGNGRVISNLFIRPPAIGFLGLVGWNSGIITNVGLVDVNIKSESGVVGGIAGRNVGTISNSYVTGAIRGNTGWIGGIAGVTVGTIRNCYSSASLSALEYIGGISGSQGNVINSFSTGEITGGKLGIAGVIGILGTATNSFAAGSVSGVTSIGGVVGTGNVVNSYWDITRTGQTAGGSCAPPNCIGVNASNTDTNWAYYYTNQPMESWGTWTNISGSKYCTTDGSWCICEGKSLPWLAFEKRVCDAPALEVLISGDQVTSISGDLEVGMIVVATAADGNRYLGQVTAVTNVEGQSGTINPPAPAGVTSGKAESTENCSSDSVPECIGLKFGKTPNGGICYNSGVLSTVTQMYTRCNYTPSDLCSDYSESECVGLPAGSPLDDRGSYCDYTPTYIDGPLRADKKIWCYVRRAPFCSAESEPACSDKKMGKQPDGGYCEMTGKKDLDGWHICIYMECRSNFDCVSKYPSSTTYTHDCLDLQQCDNFSSNPVLGQNYCGVLLTNDDPCYSSETGLPGFCDSLGVCQTKNTCSQESPDPVCSGLILDSDCTDEEFKPGTCTAKPDGSKDDLGYSLCECKSTLCGNDSEPECSSKSFDDACTNSDGTGKCQADSDGDCACEADTCTPLTCADATGIGGEVPDGCDGFIGDYCCDATSDCAGWDAHGDCEVVSCVSETRSCGYVAGNDYGFCSNGYNYGTCYSGICVPFTS